MGWDTYGNVAVMEDGPFPRCPHYVRLSPTGHRHKLTGLDNEGYFGIGVEQDSTYRFSVWARVTDAEAARLRVELIDPSTVEERQAVATERVEVRGSEWQKYELRLVPHRTLANGKLRLMLEGEVAVDVEHVSLFPVETFNRHENGLRKDIAEALAEIHPGVLRFPGGCIVEGTDLATRYNWKNTLGDVENRPLNENRWQHTFSYRLFPDYFQSYGLGFYEFFLLAEEIGAAPLPILNCGLSCQYQNNRPEAHVAVEELEEYIQDTLDLIEFANGDTATTWGRVRAEMGHPTPFNLRHIGIGNEQWGEEYVERLAPFLAAIRKAYPEMKVVGGAGPNSEGEKFDYLWPEMRRLKVDLVDEHFYRPEEWFLAQGGRYDNYDRRGPKVFAGEYACHGKGKKYNHYRAALLEAAFMTGLERNADVVEMATYAPLLAHVSGWQWRPDMIWFDNLRTVRTASYYVQQLFAHHRGTHVLSLTMEGKALTGGEGQHGLFASAVYDQERRAYIAKVANTSEEEQPLRITLQGMKRGETLQRVEQIVLSAEETEAENTLDNPNAIIPKTTL